MSYFLSRLYQMAQAYNVFNVRTVDVYFQKSPGWPNGDKRGIAGLPYTVFLKDKEIQSGKSDNAGKVTVKVRPFSTTRLKIMETMFTVKADAGFRVKTENRGLQQRLRSVGYPLGDEFDGNINESTDRAILQFQADQGMSMLGEINVALQDAADAEANK